MPCCGSRATALKMHSQPMMSSKFMSPCVVTVLMEPPVPMVPSVRAGTATVLMEMAISHDWPDAAKALLEKFGCNFEGKHSRRPAWTT